jgi:metal-responsive CopG/Arc/MetJ family transcriptional regulator
MTRITISLPEDLAAILDREAHRLNEPVSAVVRHALRAYLEGAEARPHKVRFVGLGRSGRRHTARDAEKILSHEWHRDRRR